MPRQYSTFLVALALVVASVAATTPAVAQSDSSVLDDFQDDEEGLISVSSVAAGVGGLVDRVSYRVSSMSPLSDDDGATDKATDDRGALQSVYNANSDAIEDYTNKRFSGTASDWNVVQIDHDRNGETATHYLVADVDDDGNFTNSTMTNTTDRSVDKTVVLSDFASAEADAELERFVEEYVAEDRDVDSAQMSRLASRYKGHVETPEGVA